MPLVGGKDTLAGPSITTNIGEQVKEQNGFSAATDTGNHFDLSVVHMTKDLLQIEISFDHVACLVLSAKM